MTEIQTHKHPNFTDIQCETCDGLGFTMTDDLWKPEPCECMSDAPKVVVPYKTD